MKTAEEYRREAFAACELVQSTTARVEAIGLTDEQLALLQELLVWCHEVAVAGANRAWRMCAEGLMPADEVWDVERVLRGEDLGDGPKGERCPVCGNQVQEGEPACCPLHG